MGAPTKGAEAFRDSYDCSNVVASRPSRAGAHFDYEGNIIFIDIFRETKIDIASHQYFSK